MRSPLRTQLRQVIRPVVATLAVLLALPVLGACSQDPSEDYCAAVASHQREIGEAAGTGGPDALLGALGAFRDLAAKAPSDIDDEWSQLIGSLEGLQDALDDADVDPSTYDRDKPPSGLSEQDQGRIDAAASDLVSAQTTEALSGLEQQARDVCQTQLYL